LQAEKRSFGKEKGKACDYGLEAAGNGFTRVHQFGSIGRNLSREEKELGSKRPDVQRRKVRESAKTRENKKDRFPSPSVDKWSIE